MDFHEVLKRFDAFSFRDLQTYEAIATVAVREKIPVKRLRESIVELMAEVAKGVKNAGTRIVRACPECGADLTFRQIVTPKGPRNVHGYTWNWVCMSCDYDEYSFETVEEVIEKYGVEP